MKCRAVVEMIVTVLAAAVFVAVLWSALTGKTLVCGPGPGPVCSSADK